MVIPENSFDQLVEQIVGMINAMTILREEISRKRTASREKSPEQDPEDHQNPDQTTATP